MWQKLIYLMRYLVGRLKQPRGAIRLLHDCEALIRTEGVSGFLSELGSLAQQPQRPVSEGQAYAAWQTQNESAFRKIERYEGDVVNLPNPPLIGILLAGSSENEKAHWTTRLERQTYPYWRCGVAFRDLIDCDYILMLSPDDLLPGYALQRFACFAAEYPKTLLLYADHDHVDLYGTRVKPHFKPRFNRELLLSQNYIGRCFLVRLASLREAKYVDNLSKGDHYGLLLSLAADEPDEQFAHLPEILLHQSDQKDNQNKGCQNGHGQGDPVVLPQTMSALTGYLSRRQVRADISTTPHGLNRIHYHLPSKSPHVTVIIPTRDQIPLLRQAVDGVLNRTAYGALDILIVDNDSQTDEAFNYFKALSENSRVTILTYPGAFNFSAMINHAAERASGSILCLLNNDVDVIASGWLLEMVGRAVQPGAGAVGARLLYQDKRVQHAGVFLGLKGVAGHGFKYFPREAPGYMKRLQSAQYVMAVTAACLVVDKTRFHEVGGFDASALKVAFNDVDFCLKLYEAGYRSVYTPYAELYHLESVSRGRDLTPEKRARAQKERDYLASKWAHLIVDDPFYSPHLSRIADDFSISA